MKSLHFQQSGERVAGSHPEPVPWTLSPDRCFDGESARRAVALDGHRRLQADGLTRVIPTFRPDAVVALDAPGWRAQIARLAAVAGVEVVDYASHIRALVVETAGLYNTAY